MASRVIRIWLALALIGALAAAQEPPSTAPLDVKSGSSSAPTEAAQKSASPIKPIIPFEYSPYRIHVWISAASAPQWNENRLAELRHDLEVRADSLVGSPWTLTAEAPPEALRSTIAYAPDQITDGNIRDVNKEVLRDDKIMLVSLQANSRETTIRVRELDCHTRTWGRTVVRQIRQPETLFRTTFDAVVTAFSPLVRIEEGQIKTCAVRVHAAGLVLDTDSPAHIEKGDVLVPVFRQNDRYGDPIPGRIQVIPFTFLQVTTADDQSPGLFQCNVHSAMRGPIHGRSTSRRERWALKVRPASDATELVIESRPSRRDEPKIPLAGMEIYSKTPLPEPPRQETEEEQKAAEKRNPPELLGVTDWRGSLTIPKQEAELRVMYVKNGGLLLARLPIVAGLDERLVAEVPDDNPRLQAEGFVNGMNSEIMDLVVQRQLIRFRARKKMTDGKLDEAQKLVEEFRGLPTPTDLQRMLDQQMTRQKPASNPGVRVRIEKLYADQRETIARYVDVDMLNRLTEELAQARVNPPKPDEPEPDADKVDAEPKEKKKLPGALERKPNPATTGSAAGKAS